MTCIVGFVNKGKVYMGADSAGVGGYDLRIRKDKKVFCKGEFLIGFTSSFRMGQLLRYSIDIPEQKPEQDTFEYMVNGFTNAVRQGFKNGGYASIDNNVEEGGEFLIGYRGRLFRMCSDFQIEEAMIPYNATGCGAGYALGSLFVSTSPDIKNIDPANAIMLALQAAELFSAGVRQPFYLEVSGKENG